ncbi:sensor histidine kinase [Pantanalinema sp. GBBB05]|uniref:sensor histidine kinase n=1 Tax=Pantanalinema sp. GBBB05 TaxID=2604139 RepID=UPI001D6A8E0F|nr:HAMP domain-containing histidine kinase [Pantanalinema sp. GBBB05]
MNWIDLEWVVIGVGLGWGMRSLLPFHQVSSLEPESPLPQDLRVPTTATASDRHADLVDQLEQLELACQMATEMSQFKGGFLARTSHELRSPLNGLIGMHQLILSNLCDGPEEEREFITQAHAAALKMVNVLDEILYVAKVEQGTSKLDIQPVEIANLLKDVDRLTQLLAKNRNLRLHIPLPGSELYTLADPRWLRQVLVNLVDTVITQVPEGEIELVTQVHPEANTIVFTIANSYLTSLFSESIELLQPAIAETASLLSETSTTPTITLQRQVIARSQQTSFPSPGLRLSLSQTLLRQMNGQLEVLPPSTDTSANGAALPRIQWTIPLLLPEVDDDMALG